MSQKSTNFGVVFRSFWASIYGHGFSHFNKTPLTLGNFEAISHPKELAWNLLGPRFDRYITSRADSCKGGRNRSKIGLSPGSWQLGYPETDPRGTKNRSFWDHFFEVATLWLRDIPFVKCLKSRPISGSFFDHSGRQFMATGSPILTKPL